VAEERTLVLVKPDGVRRGLVGEVIGRLERKGLRIDALRLLHIDRDVSRRHYAEHVEKGFYPDLEAFITSGPTVALVAAGPDAVKVVRGVVGPTNPVDAPPGTIRGDLATVLTENIVHGSDSVESATREIEIFFPDLSIT
jgi:nucleoside-diphosphate kinase